MSRKSRTNHYQKAFGNRLRILLEEYLDISLQELAHNLGLASTSTLRKALGGKGGLDIERLQKLGALAAKRGELPNLDWLLTGRGSPVISPHAQPGQEWMAWLSDERKKALEVLSASPFPHAQ